MGKPIGGSVVAYLRTVAANVERAAETGHEPEPEQVSPAEIRLLEALLRLGVHPEQQARIGRYFADFYFPGVRLVVEVDGRSYHYGHRAYDDERDRLMRAAGYRVMRIPASLVRSHADRCAAVVNEAIDRLQLEKEATR
jgi:very-short-patch-repair endonuclease